MKRDIYQSITDRIVADPIARGCQLATKARRGQACECRRSETV